MVSITLSVPDDIRKVMKENPEINWSALVRKTIQEKAEQLEMKKGLLNSLKKEKGFIDWSVKLGRDVKKGRLKKILNENSHR